MSYIDDRRAYRTATAGAVVKVHEDQLERFDRLNVLAAPMSSTALLDIADFMDPAIRHVDEIEDPDGTPTADGPTGVVREADTEPSDAWTVPRLQEYATAKEIDLGDATKKADILAAIQAGREN
ncbi:hypothetical protein AB0J48_20535 [Nocardia salmonicida]|uniref:hypothetical protein n=1 Tax=Nocardia salmonicida TaxID=53431 RepID=UPI00343D6517